jgi:hypothetical protein
MPRFWTPAEEPLRAPGSKRRLIRRPDVRALFTNQLSGAPLSGSEVDYDDLIIHKAYRSFDPEQPGEVRYFMHELSQKNPGAGDYDYFWKAVRMVRLTRVPRYLRQAGSAGPGLMFEQQRDLLAALREKQVLFVNLIAKSPQLPMIFAYGVQGIGATPQEAQAAADEAYAVLTYQLAGTYQQLEYAPISLTDGELLARYQAEWQHIAMGRGRPLPASSSGSSTGGLLDGNRTDVESINNQLESFIRGMGDRAFLMSLVTVPLSPAEITLAWRNITEKLSDVRSDQDGARSVTAGIALPLAMGSSVGDGHGNTHSSGSSTGTSTSDGVSESIAHGAGTSTTDTSSLSQSATQSTGTSHSVTDSVSNTTSLGQSVTHSDSLSQGVGTSTSESVSQGVGASQSGSVSQGVGTTHTDGTSLSAGVNSSQGVSVSESAGQSLGQSLSQSNSVSASQSAGSTASVGQNWSNSISAGTSASQTHTGGTSQSQANGVSGSINLSNTQGNSLADAWNQAFGNNVSGGLLGFNGGANAQNGTSGTTTNSSSNALGIGLTGTGTNTVGISESLANAISNSVSLGESFGGSAGLSNSLTNSVGQTNSVGLTQSVGSSHTTTAGQSASVGQSLSQGVSSSDASSQSLSVGQTTGQTQSLSTGQSAGMNQNLTQGQGLSQGQTLSQSAGVSRSEGVGTSQSQSYGTSTGQSHAVGQSQSTTATTGTSSSTGANQGLSDAYMVAMSRQASQTSSLSVAPSFGVTLSKQTRDEAKRFVGDILEAQMRRYADGIKSGAFLYQMFLVCPDRETLMGGSGLLKSAFWGAGGADMQLPQPFHTITDFPIEGEAGRLLEHARAFTSYRRREPVVDLIEPFAYSTYLTPGEAAAFTHPPTAESLGILSVHDSMPVLRMPFDRQDREIRLGHVVNGERAKVTDVFFSVDITELTHLLISGVTGSGKTTTLMRFLVDAVKVERTLVTPPTADQPIATTKTVRPSVLFFDWMRNGRRLASVVDPARFQFFSMIKPELGEFRWNLLAVPCENMNPVEWLNAQADNLTASFNLGEFGRSLIAEYLTELYSANRLEPYVLRAAVVDEQTGVILRPGVELPALDPATMPFDAIQVTPNGDQYANVFTCAELSRCVSIVDLATLVATRVEEMSKPEAAKLYGTAMRERLQSLWRRMQYFAPGNQFETMLAADPDLNTRECLTVWDLVDPDAGTVTVVETDGLDIPNRRVILGSVLLALYRTGLSLGEGAFDHDGKGPGTFVVLEEAHELFGEQGADDDNFSASTRTALYESMFRRARALGLRLVVLVQNPAGIPSAITSNTPTVIIHQTYDDKDRQRIFSLLNWQNQIGRHQREYSWLGEMPIGWCLVRLQPKTHYLEAAPVQLVTDPPVLPDVSDAQLAELAKNFGY